MKHFTIIATVASFLVSASQETVFAQGASSYPYVSPTAGASGMTTGIENGASSSTITMMQVRAAAQDAERDAAAAAMARSAEEAIEEEKLNRNLEIARETRRKKMEAAEALKWKKATAYNAYNKVSPREMASWKDSDGNIKIGRGLPADFVNAVREEEAAARLASQESEKKNFSPIKKITTRVSQTIGQEDASVDTGLAGPKPLPADPDPVSSVPPMATRPRGFSRLKPDFSKLQGPKLPFLGRKESPPPEIPEFTNQRRNVPDTPSPAQDEAHSPAVASSSVPSTPATPSSSTAPQMNSGQAAAIPARSGSALIQEESESSQERKFAGGLFGGNRSRSSQRSSVPGSDEERGFKLGFGKKKEEVVQTTSTVDSGLFPTGTVSSSSPGNPEMVSLPSARPEPEPRRILSLPKPRFSKNSSNSGGGGDIPSGTVINRNGNNFYVVNSSAQFMKYGETRSQTTITALSPGTLVEMTKPGDDWASVRLPDGSEGVIQTKNLRAAAGSEVAR